VNVLFVMRDITGRWSLKTVKGVLRLVSVSMVRGFCLRVLCPRAARGLYPRGFCPCTCTEHYKQ